MQGSENGFHFKPKSSATLLKTQILFSTSKLERSNKKSYGCLSFVLFPDSFEEIFVPRGCCKSKNTSSVPLKSKGRRRSRFYNLLTFNQTSESCQNLLKSWKSSCQNLKSRLKLTSSVPLKNWKTVKILRKEVNLENELFTCP